MGWSDSAVVKSLPCKQRLTQDGPGVGRKGGREERERGGERKSVLDILLR